MRSAIAVSLFVFMGVSMGAAPAAAQQAPYEPLIDQDAKGFKPAKYAKDLAFCRDRASPQEAAAAAGAQRAAEGQSQATAGAALAAAGNIARYAPVPGLGAAGALWNGGGAAEAVGGAVSGGGAAAAAEGAAMAGAAADDYQLVIDSCLKKRGYKMLR